MATNATVRNATRRAERSVQTFERAYAGATSACRDAIQMQLQAAAGRTMLSPGLTRALWQFYQADRHWAGFANFIASIAGPKVNAIHDSYDICFIDGKGRHIEVRVEGFITKDNGAIYMDIIV